MKYSYLLIILIVSFLLTSCDNDENSNDNSNFDNEQSYNFEENLDSNAEKQTKRISYFDYINETEISGEENQTSEQDDLEEIKDPNLLAEYSTSLGSSSKERVNNIKIVCERLNNFILSPGETFSYNDVCGPYGESDGFLEAPILLSDGTKENGFGGGVCQLSSTLYNVVKNIDNIEITEHHHHSAKVSYVPENQDATISLQSGLDFKFVNNNSFPIRFESTCANWKVNVSAFKN